MISFFEYMFYRFYTWKIQRRGLDSLAVSKSIANSIAVISLVLFWNIFTIVPVVGVLFPDTEIDIVLGSILCWTYLPICIVINFLWGTKQKISKLSDKYKDESMSVRKRKSIFIWLYLLVSIALFIGGMYWAKVRYIDIEGELDRPIQKKEMYFHKIQLENDTINGK